MVTLKVELSEELDRKFREKIIERIGFKRGAISEAVVQAITKWIEEDDPKAQSSGIKSSDYDIPEYRNKYLLVREDGSIHSEADNLDELLEKIPDDLTKKYTTILPVDKRRDTSKKIRGSLGWQARTRK